MESRIEKEVEFLSNWIAEANGEPLDPKECIHEAIENVIGGVVFGKRVTDDQKLREIFNLSRKLPRLAVDLYPIDLMPCLRFLPKFSNLLNNASEVKIQLFKLLEEQIAILIDEGSGDNFIRAYAQEEYWRKIH